MNCKIALRLIPVCLLAACAYPKYNYVPRVLSLSEPAVGSQGTSNVGDVMLRQGKYSEHEAIYVPTQIDTGWAYSIYPGYYLKHGEDAGAEYFLPGSGEDGGQVQKTPLADNWESVMAKKDAPDLCVVTVSAYADCKSGVAFERGKKTVLTRDSFQQCLIYNGRIGNKINIAYREFTNNATAFSNNVEYDLSESKLISYKGAQLEILEATSQFIKFKVIRNFNAADF